MSNRYEQALLDLKARQDAGEHMVCPRCGIDCMTPKLHHNALSRHADIYICDECGLNEAMLDYMNNPLPTQCWAYFRAERPAGDFEALTGQEALEIIRVEHFPQLTELFRAWIDADSQDDFEPIREQAHAQCKGLSWIREQPFQAAYRVADGQLLIRFKSTPDSVEIAADLVK